MSPMWRHQATRDAEEDHRFAGLALGCLSGLLSVFFFHKHGKIVMSVVSVICGFAFESANTAVDTRTYPWIDALPNPS